MKKTLGLLLILLIFITGYFYFNKPQPIQFKGVSDIHLAKVSADAAELRGNLIFYNPNKMRAQLGKLSFDASLNNVTIGTIHEEFATAIKGTEEFHFSFQLRFPTSDVIKGDSARSDFPISISGVAGSDVLFSNYTFPVTYSGTIKNQYQ